VTTTRFCTIAARNYLPSVELLAASCRSLHPETPFTFLALDAFASDEFRDLPFEVLTPDALDLPGETFQRMATYYSVTELATAVKPTLLRGLLAETDVVMYLDPDVELFASVSSLFDLADRHGIALTPHVLTPIPRDGLDIAEESIFLSGQFNLGFIAVSTAARDFLDYWEERTRLFAVVDPGSGYFTDQRWVDAVPTLFAHHVVRDPGCNVAYWNLHERHLDIEPDGSWSVDGVPLRFFHFSGHDYREPLVLSRHVRGVPRVRVDHQPMLRRMLRERSDRVALASSREHPAPYRWERTTNGTRLDPQLRHMYWRAVCDAEHDGVVPPPHAFGPDGGDGFCGHWTETLTSSGVSRHLYECWRARGDLRAAFPDPLGSSSTALVAWARADLQQQRSTPARLRPRDGQSVLPGINLVGYLAGEFGVASASRVMSRVIRGAGIPVANTVLRDTNHRHRARPVDTLDGAPFELSVLMLNADGLVELWSDPRLAAHHGRRRVGVWYWEVDLLPEPMRGAFDLVDEVWCATSYIQEALQKHADTPVVKHPLALTPTVSTALTRADVGLPQDRFLFGFVFDYASVVDRKNPLGLIHAYREAFGPDDGANLVLKTINADVRSAEAARVRSAADDRDDIVFLDGFLSPLEMRAFFQLLDCYVSLHRAEGLGLTMASAMAAGVPTVATGWSGNLEFMTSENSVLVPFELREVGDGAAPYPREATWADPDLGAAARAMREIFHDSAVARSLGHRAQRDMAALAVHGVGSEWLLERYEHVTGSRIVA
jgi:glycosyltransferase involved in cell wall biosynthesis